MKRSLYWIVAVLAACVLLAACSKKEDEAPSEPTPTPYVATPTPTPTPPPYEPNILTGAPRDENYVPDQRPVGIMINNITAARPQRGLSKADILVEIQVEGGITRFMPIFQDYKSIGEVGPVRSGRDQFFQLILPWRMLYVHEGQSSVMGIYSHDYQYGREGRDGYYTINADTSAARSIDYGQGMLNHNQAGAYGYRDLDRYNWAGATYRRIVGYTTDGKPIHELAYEHTLYMNSDNLIAYVDNETEKYGLDMHNTYNSTFFKFVDYRQDNPVRDLATSPDSAYTTEKYGPVVSDGEYVEITHSQSYRTRFIYDSASNQYKMQQYYSTDKRWRDTIDEAADKVQLTFPNLVVLFTDIHTYPDHKAKDLKEVVYSTGGAGYYCYGGKCERIFWQKPTPESVLQLYYLDANGECTEEQVEINIGKTYLAVVGLDYYENFAHLPLSEVSVGESGSYAGSVSGSASGEVEIGEDGAGTAGTATAATPAPTEAPQPTPTPAQEQTEHTHTPDAGQVSQSFPCMDGTITYHCTSGDGYEFPDKGVAPATVAHNFGPDGYCTYGCGTYDASYVQPAAPAEPTPVPDTPEAPVG